MVRRRRARAPSPPAGPPPPDDLPPSGRIDLRLARPTCSRSPRRCRAATVRLLHSSRSTCRNRCVAGSKPEIQAVLGQLEPFLDDERRVGVVDEIVVRDPIVLDGVVDQAAEKRDVGAGANLQEQVGGGRRPREARIDDDHLGVALQLGFDRPLEAARVVLGRIAAHDQHHVGVLDVDPAVGHRAASECGPQTGDRWTVSNPGLVFQVADPQAAHRLDDEIIEFVGVGAAAGPGDAFAAIDGAAAARLSRRRSRRASSSPSARSRRSPDPSEMSSQSIRAGPPHLRLEQPPLVEDVLLERRAFRAERAAIDRMIGIAFDVDDLRDGVLGFVAERVDDHAAADRAVRAGAARLGRARDLERLRLRVDGATSKPKAERLAPPATAD